MVASSLCFTQPTPQTLTSYQLAISSENSAYNGQIAYVPQIDTALQLQYESPSNTDDTTIFQEGSQGNSIANQAGGSIAFAAQSNQLYRVLFSQAQGDYGNVLDCQQNPCTQVLDCQEPDNNGNDVGGSFYACPDGEGASEAPQGIYFLRGSDELIGDCDEITLTAKAVPS